MTRSAYAAAIIAAAIFTLSLSTPSPGAIPDSVGFQGYLTDRGASSMGAVPQNYGEPQNDFPTWYERVIHVYTNRARSDPAADLVGCLPDCADAPCFTSALDPLQWDYDHNRAARFHAANLTDSGCGMAHDSPCQLVANISDIYPTSCDGSVSCACQGGTASCSGGSSPWDRLALFGIPGGWRGENIAWYGDPLGVFYAWLWEPTDNPTCDFTPQNGHRHIILRPNFTLIGVGGAGGYTVQDFSDRGPVTEKILAGAHYPGTGTSTGLRANWFDGTPPRDAMVNIDGTCYPMALERGTDTNGTYLYDASFPDGCHEYYFVFIDAGGNTVSYPDSGSFGINCANDWSGNRPAMGPGCTGTVVDTDGDGIPDSSDNCVLLSNADQRDTDGDNIGNICDADVDGAANCVVNFLDLNVYRANFFLSGDLDTDNNGDDITNFVDLNIVRSFFSDRRVQAPTAAIEYSGRGKTLAGIWGDRLRTVRHLRQQPGFI